MYAIVWEFVIRPERRAEFEAAYRPGGDWCRLFSGKPGYRETRYLQDCSDSDRCLVMDIWESPEDYDAFRKEHQQEYQALDRRCENNTLRETCLGEFMLGA